MNCHDLDPGQFLINDNITQYNMVLFEKIPVSVPVPLSAMLSYHSHNSTLFPENLYLFTLAVIGPFLVRAVLKTFTVLYRHLIPAPTGGLPVPVCTNFLG